MKKYKNKCGLSKQEFELERLVDAVRSEPSTLICIKILERGFKKLNTPRVSNCIAIEYAEFCVRCDREKLPLLCLEDYIKQYCR
jgi:hypothetical protein